MPRSGYYFHFHTINRVYAFLQYHHILIFGKTKGMLWDDVREVECIIMQTLKRLLLTIDFRLRVSIQYSPYSVSMILMAMG